MLLDEQRINFVGPVELFAAAMRNFAIGGTTCELGIGLRGRNGGY